MDGAPILRRGARPLSLLEEGADAAFVVGEGLPPARRATASRETREGRQRGVTHRGENCLRSRGGPPPEGGSSGLRQIPLAVWCRVGRPGGGHVVEREDALAPARELGEVPRARVLPAQWSAVLRTGPAGRCLALQVEFAS